MILRRNYPTLGRLFSIRASEGPQAYHLFEYLPNQFPLKFSSGRTSIVQMQQAPARLNHLGGDLDIGSGRASFGTLRNWGIFQSRHSTTSGGLWCQTDNCYIYPPIAR